MPHKVKVEYGRMAYEGLVYIDGQPVHCRRCEVVFDPGTGPGAPGLPYVRLEILAEPLEFERVYLERPEEGGKGVKDQPDGR